MTKLRDIQAQLESTRAELVSVTKEKARKIEVLEEMIVDLQMSRLDSADEHRRRLDGARREVEVEMSRLAKATVEEDSRKACLAEELKVAQLETKVSLHEVDRLRKSHAEEVVRHKSDIDELAAKHAVSSRSAQSVATKARDLEETVTSLQSALEQYRQQQTDFERQIVSLHNDKEHAEQQRVTTLRDLSHHEQAKESIESEMAQLKAEIAELRAENARLVDLRPARTVITSSTTTSMSKSSKNETHEVELLSKVIQAQKSMIQEQKEKIKFWATVCSATVIFQYFLDRWESQELEQQRDVVRRLTADPSAVTCTPTHRISPRTMHGKSMSLSICETPKDSPLVPGSANLKKSFPSTFTAKNLALPTSPSPLPMHPSQYSNTSTKKGRRITIEHDMDRLGG